jgi:hypothetical protein
LLCLDGGFGMPGRGQLCFIYIELLPFNP